MTTSNKKLHPSFALTPQSPRRAFFKKAGVAALMLSGLSLAKAASPNAASSAKNSSSQSIYKKQIPANKDSGEGRLFPKSDKVVLQKVRFKNLYDM